jgi:hypothetical protein
MSVVATYGQGRDNSYFFISYWGVTITGDS